MNSSTSNEPRRIGVSMGTVTPPTSTKQLSREQGRIGSPIYIIQTTQIIPLKNRLLIHSWPISKIFSRPPTLFSLTLMLPHFSRPCRSRSNALHQPGADSSRTSQYSQAYENQCIPWTGRSKCSLSIKNAWPWISKDVHTLVTDFYIVDTSYPGNPVRKGEDLVRLGFLPCNPSSSAIL
jgi:hypothetical protein